MRDSGPKKGREWPSGRGLKAACWLAVWLLIYACGPTAALAKERSIFYYVPAEDAWTSFSAHVRQIPVIAPQVFMLDEAGNVSGGVEERVRALASQHKVQILPLLANAKPEAAHNMLVNEQLRHKVVADTLRLCEENGCSGLQIDIEGVLVPDANNFTEFVREASRAFHAHHLEISVAVPPPLMPQSPGVTYAQIFGGFAVMEQPYDLRQLASLVDFMTLMTYGEYGVGTPPGPVAGYSWVEQNIRYVLQFVPAKKLSMGLGLWAYRWCNQQVTHSGYSDIASLMKQTGAQARWHVWHRASWFEFDQNGCHNIVWYEDQRSLREKLKLVRQYHLHGFSAWRLGQEDPAFWKQLR